MYNWFSRDSNILNVNVNFLMFNSTLVLMSPTYNTVVLVVSHLVGYTLPVY